MSQSKKVADLLRRFLENDVETWELDDFLASRHEDPLIENCRIEVSRIPQSFPATDSSHYASAEGLARIRAIADLLDSGDGRDAS